MDRVEGTERPSKRPRVDQGDDGNKSKVAPTEEPGLSDDEPEVNDYSNDTDGVGRGSDLYLDTVSCYCIRHVYSI